MMENTHIKRGDEAKKKNTSTEISTHKILAGHMLGNDALERVDNLVGDKLALTVHYIRSCVPILYSSDEKALKGSLNIQYHT
jgi:hypothetical protein